MNGTLGELSAERGTARLLCKCANSINRCSCILDVGWGQSSTVLIHLNIPLNNNVSQKGDGGAVELTLLSLYKQLILQETLKDLSNMENVFLGRTRENQDVVEVNKNKTCPVAHR